MSRLFRALVAVAVSLATLSPVMVASPAGAAASLDWQHVVPGAITKHSSPTIGDVNGDGLNEVVVVGHDGVVRVFKANGAMLPGWPQQVNMGSGPVAVDGSPTVADLDLDGRAEVVVGAGSLWHPNHPGGVVVFNGNGSVRWRFVTQDRNGGGDGIPDSVLSTPAVGDVNGDRYPEVVFGSWDHHIYVLDRAGRNLAGSPFYNEDTVWSSPALAEIDNDGRLEIFVGTDQSPGGNENVQGGQLRALEMSGGRLVQRWVRNVGEIIISSPAVGDIDGDGRLEVVFGTGEYWRSGDSTKVFALNAEDGSKAPGAWPVPTGGYGWSSPALGDLNGDGRLDVAIGTRDGKLYAWKGDGTRVWAVNPAAGTPYTSAIIVSGPVIGDITGDGRNEVLTATGNAVFAVAGRTGRLVETLAPNWLYQNSPAIGKVGSSWAVVTVGYLEGQNRYRIATHRIPKPGVAPPWPQFHKNAAHTGAPDSRFGINAKSGYWVLDQIGDVYMFGNARPYGSITSERARNPNIGHVQARGMVSTPRGRGYWILDQVGGIFSFGDARFYGSVPGLRADGRSIGFADLIDLAPTPAGKGYWLLDSQGGMFSFGDARFFGSVPGLRQRGVGIGRSNIISLAASPSGKGYWLLDDQGGMFAFGDARFFGSVPGLRASGRNIGPAHIVAMAPTPTGRGYWLVDQTGGMFAFGDARYYGSLPQLRQEGKVRIPITVVGMTPTRSGRGYWLLGSSGHVFAFGDARNHGSLPAFGINTTAVSLAST